VNASVQQLTPLFFFVFPLIEKKCFNKSGQEKKRGAGERPGQRVCKVFVTSACVLAD
jgi:hypothetical protein